MSFVTTSASIPVLSPLGLGLDPLQRARPERLARKIVRTSFDLGPNSSSATAQRRLPIGPRAANEGGKVTPTPSPLSRSLSTSQAHTRTTTTTSSLPPPPPPPPLRPPRRSGTVRGPRERPPSSSVSLTTTRTRNDSAPAPSPVRVEKVKVEASASASASASAEAREARAQRRHGSIFLGPADDTLRSLGHDSLSSVCTLEATSVLSGDSDATNASSDTVTMMKTHSGAASSSSSSSATALKPASNPGKSSLPQRPQPKAGPSTHGSSLPARKREVPSPLNLGGESNTTGNKRLSFHPKFSFEAGDDDEAHDSRPQSHLNVQRNPSANVSAKHRNRQRSRSASIILTPTYAISNSNSNSNDNDNNADSNSSPFPTPLTPSFRFEAPYIPEHREKRLNKLAWALGEHVPASMVFPSLPESSISATTRKSSRMGLLTKEREQESAREAHDRRSTSGTIQALDLDGVPPRASAMFPLTQPLPKQKKKNARGSSHWKPPAEWEMGPTTETTTSSTSTSTSTLTSTSMETERTGWVRRRDIDEEVLGAWNADSFDDVLQRLRHLK